MRPSARQLTVLTSLSLIAFAGNSILTRWALEDDKIDVGGFASLRIASGALTLILLAAFRRTKQHNSARLFAGNWGSAIWLFLYAIPFSFAYRCLDTGTGALLLFGLVQLTMIGSGVRSGERPSPLKWFGSLVAIGGLAYLLLPGVTAPPPGGAILMSIAGVAWAMYSLRGRGAVSPLLETGGNMLRATPLVVGASVIAFALSKNETPHWSVEGMILALLSGSVTSGIGYALWYGALPHLKATTAATVQLTVPVIATLGGVLFVGEPLTAHLAVSAVSILGGTAVSILARTKTHQST